MLILKERIARMVYTLALVCLLPVLASYLIWRGFRQPEYFKHWSERFLGLAVPRPRNEPAGTPFENQAQCTVLWVHAVSVGETRACASLIEQWLEQDLRNRVVLTHTTPTGQETGRILLSKWFDSKDRKRYRVVQRYLPYDLPWSNALFLNWAKPNVGLLMETELWPNLLAQANARGISILLANARLSLRSAKRFETFQALARPAIARLAMIAAQTQEDADRFARAGGLPRRPFGPPRNDLHVTGNMKFDITVPHAQQQLGDQWRSQLSSTRIWLAVSTRDDEEIELLKAWRVAYEKSAFRNNLLLIVPRHPQRFDRVARLIDQQGFAVARRSLQWLKGYHDIREGGTQRPVVLLGDSLGEMFAYLQLADLVLIGGSIPQLGGQNPIEACALGKPVFFGPHMFNFAQIARELRECGAGSEISSYAQWIAQGSSLFNDPAAFEAKRQAGLVFSNAHRGATQRTLVLLQSILQADR